MMNERVEYWLALADYDLESAKVMLNGGRYLYVGFMCHQTIEKGFKAVIARDCIKGDMPPRIHHLLKLADRAGLFQRMSEAQKKVIKWLNPMNIESRYPEYKEQIAEGLSADICKEIFIETEGLLCWIKEQL
jgi:HEPN domain-containing protein